MLLSSKYTPSACLRRTSIAPGCGVSRRNLRRAPANSLYPFLCRERAFDFDATLSDESELLLEEEVACSCDTHSVLADNVVVLHDKKWRRDVYVLGVENAERGSLQLRYLLAKLHPKIVVLSDGFDAESEENPFLQAMESFPVEAIARLPLDIDRPFDDDSFDSPDVSLRLRSRNCSYRSWLKYRKVAQTVDAVNLEMFIRGVVYHLQQRMAEQLVQFSGPPNQILFSEDFDEEAYARADWDPQSQFSDQHSCEFRIGPKGTGLTAKLSHPYGSHLNSQYRHLERCFFEEVEVMPGDGQRNQTGDRSNKGSISPDVTDPCASTNAPFSYGSNFENLDVQSVNMRKELNTNPNHLHFLPPFMGSAMGIPAELTSLEAGSTLDTATAAEIAQLALGRSPNAGEVAELVGALKHHTSSKSQKVGCSYVPKKSGPKHRGKKAPKGTRIRKAHRQTASELDVEDMVLTDVLFKMEQSLKPDSPVSTDTVLATRVVTDIKRGWDNKYSAATMVYVVHHSLVSTIANCWHEKELQLMHPSVHPSVQSL